MAIHSIPSISVRELAQRSHGENSLDVVDVRTAGEFATVHTPLAENVPLDRLDPHLVMQNRRGASGQPLYLICRSGGRSQKACEIFMEAGYENIVSVEGGMLAWEKADLPLVRSPGKTISLEGQVRIGAGALVLAGSVLAWFLNPAYIGLSIFVGAGLVYAGLTGSCAMGVLLSRMPWNRRGNTC